MIYKNRIIDIQKNKSFFLYGVRGSGKTKLLRRTFPQALYIDLLDRSLYQSYLSNIGRFYETVQASSKSLVIVDEIQKMPDLLDEVHRLIGSSNRRFILTGSSARKIKKTKGINLLGGRAGKMFLYPFVPEELEEDFDLHQALRYGLLPIVWASSDRGDTLKDYAETYLKEEIKEEALVRNLPAFARFLEVASLYHGQVVNMSNIAREAQTSRRSVREFFSILEDTMLGFFLPAYSSKLQMKEQKKPKFYLIDPGLARALKNNSGPVSVEEKGFLFEGLIAQILRSYGHYRGFYEKICYWSPADNKTEVDFLLKRGEELIAIEVKSSPQVSSTDCKGLRAISELSNVKKRILVYTGDRTERTIEGIDIWSFDFFCQNLKKDFNSAPDTHQKPVRTSSPFSPENIVLETPKTPIKDFSKKESDWAQHSRLGLIKNKQYNEEKSNSLYFENRKWLRDIQQLSQEFGHAKMYKEAEPVLEKITNGNLNHSKIFNLLYIYFQNGKNKQAVKLAEALLKKFPKRIEPANILSLIYESLGDKDKAIQIYENFIKLNPNNHIIKAELVLAYLKNEQIDKAKGLLNHLFDLSALSSEQISSLSVAYMRTGNVKKALEIQYQNIKMHPKNPEPQNVYFNLIIFLDKPKLSDFEKSAKTSEKPVDNFFLHPDKVNQDCYVRIKDMESLDEKEITIEKDAKIYTPEHELSKALLGKKTGDTVDIGLPFGNNKKYQVMEIKSKYIHKFHKIGKEAEAKFASKSFLSSAAIPENANIKELSKILKPFYSDTSKQKEDQKRLFKYYKEGRATVGAVANFFRKHPIEVIHELIFSSENKFISAFSEKKEKKEMWRKLDNKPYILMDLSSLLFLHWIKMDECLEKSEFNLYVCPSTIDSLKAYGEETALHSKDGSLTTIIDEQGELKKNFIPAEDIKQNLKFYIKVKAWAEQHCQKKAISADLTLPREKQIKWQTAIGKEFCDPIMALYNERHTVFLSEDVTLRNWTGVLHQEINQTNFESGKALNPFSIRIFDLIDYFEQRAVITESEAIRFKADLVKLNQVYIPIDHKVLLFLLKEADYAINNIYFQRGLFFLSPVSNFLGVVKVVANFLIEICQNPAVLPYQKQVIINEILDKATFGRKESSKQTAYRVMQLVQIGARVLPLLQYEIRDYIRQWLREKIF